MTDQQPHRADPPTHRPRCTACHAPVTIEDRGRPTVTIVCACCGFTETRHLGLDLRVVRGRRQED